VEGISFVEWGGEEGLDAPLPDDL